MGFFTENQNFIYIKLGHEMKGLTPDSKYEKFIILKSEVNTRLKKSYENLHTVEAKIYFYDEAFSWLGEYHSDYLLINLFFEKEFSKLYPEIKFPNYLNNGNSFVNDLSGLLNQESAESKVNEVIRWKISEEFDLKPNDWHNRESHSNPIVSKLAIEMAKPCENYDQFLNKIFWFEKLWQMTFENLTPHTKGTVFLAKFTSELNKNSDYKITFASNYLKYSNERNLLFVEKIKLPIFYSRVDLEELNYKGVTVQKEKFDNIISEYIIIEELNQYNYVQVFENFDRGNQIIRSRAQSIIDEKLNRGELPSKSDIVKISLLSGSNEFKSLRNYLIRRTYLFEFNFN